jgi:hypothetical protein
MAIDSMYEVNTLIDRGMNASASGDPEVAAQLYWVAASRTRAIANLYRDSTETLFNLTYKDGYVFGDIARFQSFILQTCTLSCNTYNIAAQLYKAAGDSASAERILEAKECIHRIKGLHEDNPLNAQELRLAFSLELKQSLLHLGAVPQFQPENLELNPDLADAIEKINIETHSIQHGAAIQVFDEL